MGVLWGLNVLKRNMCAVFSTVPGTQSKINVRNYFIVDIMIIDFVKTDDDQTSLSFQVLKERKNPYYAYLWCDSNY